MLFIDVLLVYSRFRDRFMDSQLTLAGALCVATVSGLFLGFLLFDFNHIWALGHVSIEETGFIYLGRYVSTIPG